MAKKKNGGFINRLIMGSEKSEGFARASLPSNRWELFWDIFKSRFWKLVLINLLVVLFCLPIVAFFYIRLVLITGYGSSFPFANGFGVGYLAPTAVTGRAESIVVSVTLIYNLLLPAVAIIAALGISGGLYVLRNMVWTEGIFVANDFWKGIKQNFRQVCLILVLYAFLIYLSTLSLAILDWRGAVGSLPNWAVILLKSLTYVGIVFISIMACHMITFSITYKLKFFQLIKNAFLFTICLIPANVVFGAICFFFVWGGIMLITKLGALMAILGAIYMLLIGLVLPLLIWSVYSQWCFDTYINVRMKGVKKNRGIYEKIKPGESDTAKKYKEQRALLPTSSFGLRPIKPITDEELKIEELTEGFSRKDIEKLNESKRKLYEDNERYIEEHKNDEKYRVALSEKDKKEEERLKRIEQAKKELKKRKFK